MLTAISTPLWLPRAHLDPITSPQDILAVLSLAIRRPLQHEVIALLMDNEQRGIGLLSFNTAPSHSALIDQLIGLCSTTSVATSIAIASVRPNKAYQATDHEDWLTMNAQCQRAGITFRDWIVVSRGSVRHVHSSFCQ